MEINYPSSSTFICMGLRPLAHLYLLFPARARLTGPLTPLEKSPANYTDLPADGRTSPPLPPPLCLSLFPGMMMISPSVRPSARVRRPSGVLIPAEVVILKIDTNRGGVTDGRTTEAANGTGGARRETTSRGRAIQVTETEWKFDISEVSV